MTGEITLKALLYYILKAKYLSRKKVVNKKTGKMVWGDYKYKPASQRGAHEFTKKVFEKKTKLTDSTHKDSVEKILQNGGHVNLRILRDYPDLAKKYNQEARLVAADKIRARVKKLKNSAKVPSSPTDDKGREEKKMSELKGKDMPLRGNEKIHERFYEDAKGYFVDYATNGFRPRILVGVGTKENEIARDSNGEFEIREPKGFEIKDLKERGVDPNNYIIVNGSPVRKEAKAGIESAIKRFEEIALEDPYERKQKERKRLESLEFPSGKIEEIENSLEDEQRGFNKFMESEEDYSKMKPSKYTIADLEAEYAKYPKFVTHRKLKDRAYRLTDPDELDAIYAKMAELEKS